MESIPIIDISILLHSNDEQSKLDKAQEIRRICETVGCAHLVGHGIEKELIDSTVSEARRFFEKGTEEKQQYAVQKWNKLNQNKYRGYFPAEVNGKEGLDLCSPYMNRDHDMVKAKHALHELNKWVMSPSLVKYWNEMWRLALQLMSAFARTFDLDPPYFENFLDYRLLNDPGTLSTLRFNFYPLMKEPHGNLMGTNHDQPLSCDEHYDNCILTLLYQHEVGGLQIKTKDGHWVDIDVVPYSFVLNIGKGFERWTNGHVKAVFHRVKFLNEERLSIPFFLEGCYSTPIIPIVKDGEEANYEAVNYGVYILESNKSHKEYQRDTNGV